ncbi:MAG: zinc ribbon domain-containing protein [Deltaproteobacteria bacterium]|nr:zinc ribbon domain-containing protein [Deltaproteobacteria bacterium]
MPIYEYKCQKCGRQFEAFQGISDSELKACKFCKGKVHKLVSLSSFSLKGTGWYATDYKGKKPTAKAKKEKSETSDSSTTTTKETAKIEPTKPSES